MHAACLMGETLVAGGRRLQGDACYRKVGSVIRLRRDITLLAWI